MVDDIYTNLNLKLVQQVAKKKQSMKDNQRKNLTKILCIIHEINIKITLKLRDKLQYCVQQTPPFPYKN